PRVNGYFAAEPGLRVDGAQFGWDANGEMRDAEHEKRWTKAVTLGRGALREEQDAPNNWQLEADRLPPMEIREVAPGKVVRATGAAMTPGAPPGGFILGARSKLSVLIDNGELTTGYPVLAVKGGHGAVIRVTYAEALVDDKGQKGNR